MGNAAIYYYPEANGPLVTIDLGEPLSDMQIQPVRVVDTNTGRDFEPQTVDLGGTHRVRFVLERFTGDSLVNKLRTWESAALRGLPFGIVSDTDFAWGAFATAYTVNAGRSSIVTKGNVFTNWSQVTGLSATDPLVIHGGNPEYKHEQIRVSSFNVSTGVVDFGSATTAYTYTVGPVFLRHRDFLPFCYLDPSARGGPILTHDHRINYTLDVTAIYSPGGIKALYGESGGEGLLIGTDTPVGYNAGSLQQVQEVALGGPGVDYGARADFFFSVL